MRKLFILALIALEIAVGGCGTHTPNTTVTTSAGGNWQAILLGGQGQSGTLDFVTAFTVGTGGGTLDIASFSFLTAGVCFANGESESGSATLVTDSSNNVTGTMSYTVTGTSTGVTLTLDGTAVTGTSNAGKLTGGVVTGTWSLTSSASGCTSVQAGTFTLTQTST